MSAWFWVLAATLPPHRQRLRLQESLHLRRARHARITAADEPYETLQPSPVGPLGTDRVVALPDHRDQLLGRIVGADRLQPPRHGLRYQLRAARNCRMVRRQRAGRFTPKGPIDRTRCRRPRKHEQMTHGIDRLRELPGLHSAYSAEFGQPSFDVGGRVGREPAAGGAVDVRLGVPHVPLRGRLLDAGFVQ